MACVDDETLARYASGSLAADGIPAVDHHLDQCDTCRRVLADALASTEVTARAASSPSLAEAVPGPDWLDRPTPEGRYRILRLLGQGGMGVVYEALDCRLGTRVAIKTLRDLDGPLLLRLKREFRALADLRHPNLVQLRDLVHENDRWFFTMELVHGRDFLHHVRPTAATFDEARLRAALVQVADGLAALHRAEKVHRDVKPSNILVEDGGRVVLLDFGLVAEATVAGEAFDPLGGTLAYMAPEQRAGGAIGPAADCYALGVMLYQSLTGHLPGPALAAPSRRDDGVPSDLEALCLALLQGDPGARPSAVDVRARARLQRAIAEPPVHARPRTPAAPTFVGRGDELASLNAALAQANNNTMAIVIEGESGVGKTALVRHFAEAAVLAGTFVLHGRCHERESVPYNALDGVVDAISHHLGRLPPTEREALLPAGFALLTDAFPVLLGLDPRPVAALAVARPADPTERRRRMYAAFRALLGRLALRGPPMVIAIDDLQWSDADSLSLLADLVSPAHAPPLLLVATARMGTTISLPCAVSHMTLGGLPIEEACVLAHQLIERDQAGESRARALAEEADGHPLFIAELARHAGAGLRGHQTLDEALGGRVAKLGNEPRQLLELIAVAAGPIAHATLVRAAGQPADAYTASLAFLRGERLARTTGDLVETYHDKVRAAVISHASPPALRRCHESLAIGLEATPGADGESLAVHWRGAGRPSRAAPHAVRAGDHAAEALAFDRAARLYSMALELHTDRPDLTELHVRLARALANAGREVESADAYLAAARTTKGPIAIDLKRRAAVHLLASSQLEKGLPILDEVLTASGLRRPRGDVWAFVTWLLLRARLALRGLGFRLRPDEDIPAGLLAKVDACESAAVGLIITRPAVAVSMHARYLVYSLSAGEPQRLVLALMAEILISSMFGLGGLRRAHRLLPLATELVEGLDQPLTRATLLYVKGVLAYHEGRWQQSEALLVEAERVIDDRCVGAHLEQRHLRISLLCTRLMSGRLTEMKTVLAERVREADVRADTGASIIYRTGLCTLVRLANDDVDGARSEIARATTLSQPLGFFRRFVIYGRLTLALYCEDVAGIRQGQLELRRHWWTLRLTGALRMPVEEVEWWDMRGRSALAAAVYGDARHRPALLREARRAARWLARTRAAWAAPHASMLQAGLALATGDRDEAARLFERAADGFAASDLPLRHAVAQRRAGELIGGDAGHGLIAAADQWFERAGIRGPARFTRIYSPRAPDAPVTAGGASSPPG